MSRREEKKRIVRSAADLVFYTDTDESEYPIYVTADREVWLKAKPHTVEALDEYTTVKRYNIPVIAMFYVRCARVEDGEQVVHPLLDTATAAVREVTKEEPEVLKYAITYEVYRGETELIGEAGAYVIKVVSRETPFSGVKNERDRAWAVGFTWRKRLAAKYPQLAQYVYLVGENEKGMRARVRLAVKLPVVTPELEKLFSAALQAPPPAPAPAAARASLVQDVQELERLIAEKERELAELRARLEELKRLSRDRLSGRVASLGVGA